MEENIIEILKNKKYQEKYIKNKYPDIYNKILLYNNKLNISWLNKLYNFLFKIKEKKCKNCGKLLKFREKISIGYGEFCSKKCVSQGTREKVKETNLKKFGVKYPLQNKDILEKFENTNLKKYGSKTSLLNNDIKKKIEDTNLKRYGFKNPSQSEEIKNIRKNTNLKRYGVDNVFRKDEVIKSIQEKRNNKSDFEKQIIQEKIKENKKKKIILKLSKILNIQIDDIKYINGIFIIKNYCKIHNEFHIKYIDLYNRIKLNIKDICSKCHPILKNFSIKENEIKEYINYELKIKTDKITINNKEIDIYLPDYKLGIEFDGIYWHSDKFKDKNYHLNKTELCKINNIQLLHIFEDEWDYKKEIVKNIIKSKLNIYKNIINDYEIKEIDDNQLINNFLEKNHIFGYVESDINIGLFNDNELVSLIIFKKINENKYEILRFCDKLNTLVINSINNLLEYFIKNFNPKSIITFLDRRYDNGDNIYKKLGFKFIENTKPNYHYFKKNNLIRNIELEHQVNNNYLKIFDCGNMNFILNK